MGRLGDETKKRSARHRRCKIGNFPQLGVYHSKEIRANFNRTIGIKKGGGMTSPYRNDYKLGELGVNNNTRAIFDLMRTRMDEENIIHLSVDLKLKFMAKTTSRAAEPLDAFKTILITLQKAGVICRKTVNAFMVNPDYGVRYENSAKRIRENWNTLIRKRRESRSRTQGTRIPRNREPDSLQQGTTLPPLKLVK